MLSLANLLLRAHGEARIGVRTLCYRHPVRIGPLCLGGCTSANHPSIGPSNSLP